MNSLVLAATTTNIKRGSEILVVESELTWVDYVGLGLNLAALAFVIIPVVASIVLVIISLFGNYRMDGDD